SRLLRLLAAVRVGGLSLGADRRDGRDRGRDLPLRLDAESALGARIVVRVALRAAPLGRAVLSPAAADGVALPAGGVSRAVLRLRPRRALHLHGASRGASGEPVAVYRDGRRR